MQPRGQLCRASPAWWADGGWILTITEAKAYTLRGEVLVREGAPVTHRLNFHPPAPHGHGPGSHQPAKARHFGPSFQQLLLLAFC